MRHMKLPRFRLRTLLIAIALLSIPMSWVAYQLSWIRQRHEFLLRRTFFEYEGFVLPAKHLPWSLSLFGEKAEDIVFTTSKTSDEAKRLFPESQIYIVRN